MVGTLRRNFLRLSEFLREQLGAKGQGAILQKAAVGTVCSSSNGILRGVCTLREKYILEAPAVSDSRCSLCDGLCSAREADGRRTLLPKSASLSSGPQEHSMFRL